MTKTSQLSWQSRLFPAMLYLRRLVFGCELCAAQTVLWNLRDQLASVNNSAATDQNKTKSVKATPAAAL